MEDDDKVTVSFERLVQLGEKIDYVRSILGEAERSGVLVANFAIRKAIFAAVDAKLSAVMEEIGEMREEAIP